MKREYLTVASICVILPLVCLPAHASNPLVASVDRLRVSPENNSGYSRTAMGYRSSTRAKVLVQESLVSVRRNSSGVIISGRWYDPWINRTFTRASDVDIDHTVALAEAWGSGARKWSHAKRVAFSNDLTYKPTLRAIDDYLNQAVKSDKDPARWMPSKHRCQYIKDWTGIKLKYGLTINASEKSALRGAASKC